VAPLQFPESLQRLLTAPVQVATAGTQRSIYGLRTTWRFLSKK
jgi:hypothetical protein